MEDLLTARQLSAIVDVPVNGVRGSIWGAIAQSYFPPPSLQPDDPGGVYNSDHRRCLEGKVFAEQFLKRGRVGGSRPHLHQLQAVEKANRGELNFALNIFNVQKRSDPIVHRRVGADRRKRRKGLSKNIFAPVYVSPQIKRARKVINLLVQGDLERPELELTYSLIHDLSRLVLPRKQCDYDCCNYCLNPVSKTTSAKHMEYCLSKNGQKIVMPEKHECVMDFRAGTKRYYSPITGYFDFESSNSYRRADPTAQGGEVGHREGEEVVYPEKVARLEGQELLDFMSTGTTYTNHLAEQKPNTYCLAFVGGSADHLLGTRTRSADGDELMQLFIDDLYDCYSRFEPFFNDMAHIKPVLTERQREEFMAADTCWICGKNFYCGNGMDKVLDHAHSSLHSGRYLGAAHRSCNSSRQRVDTVTLFCHNLSKYDGTFIIRALLTYAFHKVGWEISAIPLNHERFFAFRMGKFQFVDSLHFMVGSLDNLVGSAVASGYDFPLLKSLKWKDLDGAVHKDYCLRKGCYPYRVAISARQLEETTELPPQGDFYSDLGEKEISDEDFAYAHTFWNVSGCANLLDYTQG